ncbi:1-deoxy-D-xylulose-5-phosphate synthase [Ruminococcaceae bacterium OttesenSCG-928-O06]|nr:1-deoxy-D-xylulose-5-phosphate synthase [Ruminococcaceae bacterium OttesenSCG-928-O06]
MEYRLLEKVHSPQDLKRMDLRELEVLCREIRHFLIENVSKTGGHLSSNLGMIEVTVALHRFLNTPVDAIVFDVGHQSYTHKLLTGRREGFDKLRAKGGLSGFPSPQESAHDAFITGHGSTSLSVAVGLARARKMQNQPGLVVAVLGDGAFTGGMVYEGMNNIGELDNLVVILNDNEMSISKNVGAVAQYLTRLRTSPTYYRAKKDVKNALDHTPVIGSGIVRGIQGMKAALRKTLYSSTFFEEMGLRYVGPLDGHDLPALCEVVSSLPTLHKPLFLHVETHKGKGFVPAEKNPGAFHGVSSFNAAEVTDPEMSPSDSFSTVFGQKLAKLAAGDERICAITAAMKYGTGLQYMKKQHLARFFDVGMAEEHAVTFAAALAAGGMRPVVAIYSTFLQRAYDQIIHDVMLGGQDVLFAIDRAGLVPGDGETHQGIYDAAFLSQQPDLPVFSPSNYTELDYWLEKLLAEYRGPRAIRYPRGKEDAALAGQPCTGNKWDRVVETKGAKVALVSYGTEIAEARAAAVLLQGEKLPADVYQMVQINPLPEGLSEALKSRGYKLVLFAEEGVGQGGIGEHLALQLLQAGFKGRFVHRALVSNRIDHATLPQLRQDAGLDALSLAAAVRNEMGRGHEA